MYEIQKYTNARTANSLNSYIDEKVQNVWIKPPDITRWPENLFLVFLLIINALILKNITKTSRSYHALLGGIAKWFRAVSIVGIW